MLSVSHVEATALLQLMISKIQRSRCQFSDVTITGSLQTGVETTVMQAIAGPESAFDGP